MSTAILRDASLRDAPQDEASKRYVVFQTLGQTLGIKREIWRILDKCHGLRNALEYDGSFNVDTQLLDGLLAAAEETKDAVEKLGRMPGARTGRR